jgi:hypothetical protein
MLNYAEPDECCGAALSAALLAGLLDGWMAAKEWTHEECGTTWKVRQVGSVRHWTPQISIALVCKTC